MRFLLLLVVAMLATPAFATFQLTKYNAYGFIIDSDIQKRAVQRAVFHITAANTDIDLDLSDSTGTFWTAAKADTTYGAMATKASASLTKIQAIATALNFIGGLNSGAGYCDTAATSGGAVTETVTCSGLLATDKILAITQRVKGANSTALNAFVPSNDGYITLGWTADPGASSISRVQYLRSNAGAYAVSISSYTPDILFVSGSAPTSYKVVLEWELQDEKYIIRDDYN